MTEKSYKIAIIDEDNCIGCTKCLEVCPTDAIIGAAKQLHTVLPELCIGCKLCIAPCPVDCISMQPIFLTKEQRRHQAEQTKIRYQARKLRLQQTAEAKKAADLKVIQQSPESLLQAAIERAKLKRKNLTFNVQESCDESS